MVSNTSYHCSIVSFVILIGSEKCKGHLRGSIQLLNEAYRSCLCVLRTANWPNNSFVEIWEKFSHRAWMQKAMIPCSYLWFHIAFRLQLCENWIPCLSRPQPSNGYIEIHSLFLLTIRFCSSNFVLLGDSNVNLANPDDVLYNKIAELIIFSQVVTSQHTLHLIRTFSHWPCFHIKHASFWVM